MNAIRKKAEHLKREYHKVKKQVQELEHKRSTGDLIPLDLMKLKALEEDRQRILDELKKLGKRS